MQTIAIIMIIMIIVCKQLDMSVREIPKFRFRTRTSGDRMQDLQGSPTSLGIVQTQFEIP